MLKSTDFLWRIIAPAGGQGGVMMSYLWFSLEELRVVGFSWEEALQLVVRNLWRKI